MIHKHSRNPFMVAEQSSEPRPRDQPASSAQCVPMECADALDVCNGKQSDDHFNVEFRAEAP